MGNNNHGGIALVQRVFQPADGVDVQVVGGLIQQQNIGIREQGLRQQHPQLPARGDFAHGAKMLVYWNPRPHQQLSRAGFGSVAIVLGKFTFELGGVHVVVFGGFEVSVNGIFFRHRRPHFGVPHQHHVNHALVFVGKLVLTQLTQAQPVFDGDRALARLKVAAQNFHKSRFAAAVGTNQPVPVAVAKFNRHLIEQWLGTELHGDIGSGNHAKILARQSVKDKISGEF